MMKRRFFLFAAAAALTVAWRGTESRAAAMPTTTLKSFYNSLLAVMKDGQKLGFVGRRQKLAPAIAQAFDLSLMTRLVVGLPWPSLSADEQKQLVAAFTDFSVATYASQFDDFSGERFEIDPRPAPAPGNDVIVKTRLIQSNGEPVQLDYHCHARSRASGASSTSSSAARSASWQRGARNSAASCASRAQAA